jgi:WD40-like Beta Propeller Repeat
VRTEEHTPRSRAAKSAVFAMLACLAVLALVTSVAQAHQGRVFTGTFGAASNPAPFPANPYPLATAGSVAVDGASHDVYVADPSKSRVEKFDASGDFMFMFGSEVNKTAVEEARPEAERNVCPAAGHPADACQAGKEGSTPGAFEGLSGLAVDNSSGASNGDIYVDDTGRQVGEEQSVTVNATGGTYTLSFDGRTSEPLAYNAPIGVPREVPGSVGYVIEHLVGVEAEFALEGVTGAYTIQFRGSSDGRDIPQITCDASALSGGAHTCATATVTQGSSTARVEKFDSSGRLVASWGKGGQLDGSSVTDPPYSFAGPFVRTDGIAVDPSGNLWVSAENNDLNRASSQGNAMFEFHPDASFVGGWTGLFATVGLAVDSQDNFYMGTGTFVQKYSSTGVHVGVVAPSQSEYRPSQEFYGAFDPLSLAFDASTNDLYLAGHTGRGTGEEPEVAVIRRYDSSCHPVITDEVPEPGCAPVEAFGEGLVSARPSGLAVDPSNADLYLAEQKEENKNYIARVAAFQVKALPDVTTTKPTSPTHTSAILTGSVNPSGVELNAGIEGCRFEWGETTAYGHVEPCEQSAAQIGAGSSPVEVRAAISGLQAGKTYHYRLVASNPNDVNASIDQPEFGDDVAFGPPLIVAASAVDVTGTSAAMQAEVNPNDLDTHIRIEYGTQAGVYDHSTEVQDVGSAGSVQTAVFDLSGLAPATTYHYRLVAENVLAEGEEAPHSADLLFTTQGVGGGGLLDGRRWELVSPPDKLGASLKSPGFGDGVIEASPSGDAFTYRANAPTEPSTAGNSSDEVQVLSVRGQGSWASRDITLPHSNATGLAGNQVTFFSPDLSQAVVTPFGPFDASLSPEASEETAYLHTNFSPSDPSAFCTASCYHPLVTGKEGFANVPSGTEFGGYERLGQCAVNERCGPQVVGASPDWSHLIMESRVPLVEGATEDSLYEWSGGELQLVSVRPGPGEAAPSPGLGDPGADTRSAVSSDGSRVIWAEGVAVSSKLHLYLRDVARGETLQLDAVKGGSGKGVVAPYFKTASADGSVVYFSDEQQLTSDSGASAGNPDLYECDVVEGEGGELECDLTDLTPERSGEGGYLVGVSGASADGSYLYFVADGVLAANEGAGGAKAAPGDCQSFTVPSAQQTCNLYVRHGGTVTFIANLSGEDTSVWAPNGSSRTVLAELAARVSPNGQWLAFMSVRSLTGYDNRDVVSGRPDLEVYLYHAGGESEEAKLVCASCNPTGARPDGVELGQLSGHGGLIGGEFPSTQGIAAIVPYWTGAINGLDHMHQPRFLSDSGRLFFTSFDALVPRDSNSTADVYEYEPPGVGTCSEESHAFVSINSGCLGLVSSGTSKSESVFLDASESGGDVFFLTQSQLTKRDTDTSYDVYDARVEGGEEEPLKPVECAGDACQSLVAAPDDPTPGSLTFTGPGNLLAPMPGALAAGKAKPLTRAQKLARALKACKSRPKRKRSACERQARRAYGPVGKAKKSKRRGR